MSPPAPRLPPCPRRRTLDTKIIQELLALMDEGGLTELHYVQGDTEIRLSRKGEPPTVVHAAPAPAQPAAAPPAAPIPAPAEAAPAPVEEEGELLRSPMVGTFYSRPNPEAPPYVQPGDSVTPDTVLCLLEAMKVFNEIKAEFHGTILEVLVQDGEAVEYDQPLFRYRRSS